VERTRKSVHIFGPSTLSSGDQGEGRSLLDLTRKALDEVAPEVEWDCRASVLYVAPGMEERLERTLTVEGVPDVVVLRFPQNQYMSDYVVYRVRELWPGLFRGSVRIAAFLIRLAGGGPEGAPSWRGMVFRAPRWLLAKVMGVAPAVRVEKAVEYATASIDSILRMEDVHLAYMMPTQTVRPNISAAEAQRRREYFVEKVSAYCDRHNVPWLDPAGVYREAGRVRGLAGDRWHSTVDDRVFDASILAQVITQSASGCTRLDVQV
jgi:hypothetical protein